jgi:hypothetical protein
VYCSNSDFSTASKARPICRVHIIRLVLDDDNLVLLLCRVIIAGVVFSIRAATSLGMIDLVVAQTPMDNVSDETMNGSG